MEIKTQLYGPDSDYATDDMLLLASVLEYFNNVDDDEVPLLFEQAKAIFARVQGSLTRNVAACEGNLGGTYYNRARRAQAANDLDRNVANLELALLHFREATRVYQAANLIDRADQAAQQVAQIEEALRKATIARARSTATATAASRG